MLDGVNECCREEREGRSVRSWEDEGKKFKLERHVNEAGRFVLCSVIDLEAKRFCVVFLKGKGLIGGWAMLAKKLCSLGVITLAEIKAAYAPVEDEGEKSNGSKGASETRAFVDVAKVKAGMVGDAFWIQLGGRELCNKEGQLGRCLIGTWGESTVLGMELALLRRWVGRLWNLKKGARFLKLGSAFFLVEFEDKEEVERVLKRGVRRFKEKVLHLEKWCPEAGCFNLGVCAKEAWVRVIGLPLNCWN